MTALWHLPSDLWQALWLTLRLAASATAILLVIVLPVGWWLAHTHRRIATLVEVAMSMPLVLPPTVIGFYLLILLSPSHWLGHGWQILFHQTLPFSFAGLVIGSCCYSLPFALQPVLTAFRALRGETEQAAYSLGMTKWQTFLHVSLPLSRAGIFSGGLLAFAHTVGEFGVVLMLGGNIPGTTRVASIALYDATQKLDYVDAHGYALLLLFLSFVMLFATTLLQKRQERWKYTQTRF